jgi:hypothetical protein
MPPLNAPTLSIIRIRGRMLAITLLFSTHFAASTRLRRASPKRCLALSEEHGFRQCVALRGLFVAGVAQLNLIKRAHGLGCVEGYRGAGYQLAITALYFLSSLAGRSRGSCAELIEEGLATTTIRNSERKSRRNCID